MARDTQGLTARQSKFLNTLALGHGTTEQVERQLGLAKYTLRRWMDQPKFVDAWRQTNELLKLRAGADAAILAPRAAADATTPEKAPDASAPTPPPFAPDTPLRPRHDPAPRPPKSDRDLIRLRHGEEAARAFDELLRAHRAPDPGEAASAAGPPPAPVASEPAAAPSS